MKEDLHSYEASDYAGIDVPRKGIKLYYGYEITDADENWCFQADFPGRTITLSFPVLKHQSNDTIDQWECGACLRVGIAILIERGDLKT